MASSDKQPSQDGFLKPRTLGSKSRSFIPMTPRSLKTNREHRNDFARQVAEQSNARDGDGQPPQKRFRSNAAPKGTRLASGYVDRAQERQKEKEDAGEDKQKRLKALEEMMKLQQIDQATFEALRDEIGIGGDTSTTHLVKGLDFKLLERIRRGDNVDEPPKEEVTETAPDEDVEDELEKALEKDVTALDSSKAQEVNNEDDKVPSTTDTTSHTATLSRDELLQRLKKNRKKPDDIDQHHPPPAVEPETRLDQSRFRKLETNPKSGKHKFTETINGRRREVLVITDKEGKTKRKTRWLDPEPEPSTTKNGVGQESEAWGGDLPAEVLARQKAAAEEEAARQKALDEEDDGDIFGGVADYDPLAAIDSDEEEKPSTKPAAQETDDRTAENEEEPDTETTLAAKRLKSTSKPRNYFSTSTDADSESKEDDSHAPSHDPAILAALKRAAQIRQQEEEEEVGSTDPSDPSKPTTQQPSEDQTRRKALLEKLQKQSGYDDVDIDMGFGGGSRYDDEDEEEGDGKQKLSQWKGLGEDGDGGDDDEEGEKKGGGAKRKRGGGGKKKKGDKNSFKDVMSVIEGRKKT